jgi:hypothetical protein
VILGLSPESRQLLPEQDLRDAEAMLRELEEAIDREGNWQAPAIREWLQRMLFGFSNVAYAGDSDTAKRLRKLHRELLPESGSAPETPPGERPLESSQGMIRLQADKPNCLTLEWLPDGIPKDASVQYPVLGFIKATNRFVAIEVEGEGQTRTQVAQIELPTRPGKRDFPWRPGQLLRMFFCQRVGGAGLVTRASLGQQRWHGSIWTVGRVHDWKGEVPLALDSAGTVLDGVAGG